MDSYIYYVPVNPDGTLGAKALFDAFYGDVTSYNFGIAIADFDNDGDCDVVFPHGKDGNIWFYEKLGAGFNFDAKVLCGTFIEPDVNDTAVGDFNNDGNMDFLLSGDAFKAGRMQIYLGNGDGTFQPAIFSPDLAPMAGTCRNLLGKDAADFNGDGILDVATGVRYGDALELDALYLWIGIGNGNCNLGYQVNYDGNYGVVTDDFDCDGKKDIVYSKGFSFYIMRGDGTGNFTGPDLFGSSAKGVKKPMERFLFNPNQDSTPDIVYNFSDSYLETTTIATNNNCTVFADSSSAIMSLDLGGIATPREIQALPPVAVTPVIDNPAPQQGDMVCVSVGLTDASDLYAASFDMLYSSSMLDYQNAAVGSATQFSHFLAEPLNGDVLNGSILVGASRSADELGISGSLNVATLCFQAVGAYCSSSEISMSNCYLENPEQGSSIPVDCSLIASVQTTLPSPANLLVIDTGVHDQLDLTWDAVLDATEYKIFRSDTSGVIGELIGTSATNSYSDATCVLATLDYYYTVIAVAGTCESDLSAEAPGIAAGILGDINNDGRVDGRDLSQLARAFGAGLGAPRFDCRADLNRDNLVDGGDLTLLAVDFGRSLP